MIRQHALILALMASGAHAAACDNLNHDDSLAGAMTAGASIRPDVETCINSVEDTARQKAALRQSAKSMQAAVLVSPLDKAAVQTVANEMGRSSACLHAVYPSGEASKKSSWIEKITINTKQRYQAYQRFSAALSGATIRLPMGVGCAD